MKYEILQWFLNGNTGTSMEVANKLKFPIDSVRVIISKLKSKGELTIVGNKNNEYIYRHTNTKTITVDNNNYNEETKVWVAFRELFGFFLDIMKNGKDLISNRKLWNEIWNKREKYKDLIYEIGEKLPKVIA